MKNYLICFVMLTCLISCGKMEVDPHKAFIQMDNKYTFTVGEAEWFTPGGDEGKQMSVMRMWATKDTIDPAKGAIQVKVLLSFRFNDKKSQGVIDSLKVDTLTGDKPQSGIFFAQDSIEVKKGNKGLESKVSIDLFHSKCDSAIRLNFKFYFPEK